MHGMDCCRLARHIQRGQMHWPARMIELDDLTQCPTLPNTHRPTQRFAGWWGLVVAGIAWYIAAADTINEQYKRVSAVRVG